MIIGSYLKAFFLAFLIIIIFISDSFSQILFEKGYYITNSNERIECLIKNVDWKYTPSEFKYKLSENDDPQQLSIESVKEFCVYDQAKFIRETLQIDRSSEDLNNLSSVRKAEFNEETHFLMVLVEGKGSLYSYKEPNFSRFFYKVDESDVIQLIHKKYKAEEFRVAENNRFKQQLLLNVKCTSTENREIEKTDYKKDDLIDYFIKYNECVGSSFKEFQQQKGNSIFNLNIRPAYTNTSLSIENSVSDSRNTQFDRESGFRIGVEAEFILPFNKNKWAIYIEPSFQYFYSEKTKLEYSATADYSSLEIPIGLRHYFFLSENSKLFVNAHFILDFTNNSIIDFDSGTDLEIGSRNNFGIGAGYKYNDKYSIELRYNINRDILAKYALWSSNYSTFSVIVGYNLF